HLSEFLSIANQEENLEEVRVYLGVSYLIENNTKDAKYIFDEVIKEGVLPQFIQASEWYMALTLLKEKDAKQARKALQKIANDKSHKYKDDAAKLLPKLTQYIKG